MAEGNAPAAATGGNGQEGGQQQEAFGFATIIRFALMFFAIRYFMSNFQSKPQEQPDPALKTAYDPSFGDAEFDAVAQQDVMEQVAVPTTPPPTGRKPSQLESMMEWMGVPTPGSNVDPLLADVYASRQARLDSIPQGKVMKNAFRAGIDHLDVFIVLSTSSDIPGGEVFEQTPPEYKEVAKHVVHVDESLELDEEGNPVAPQSASSLSITGMIFSTFGSPIVSAWRALGFEDKVARLVGNTAGGLASLSTQLNATGSFDRLAESPDEPALLWQARGVEYSRGSHAGPTRHLNITLPQSVLRNESAVFAHTFVTKHGVSPDPGHESYDETAVYVVTYPVVFYRPKKKQIENRSLLESMEEGDEDRQIDPQFGIGLVDDATAGAKAEAEAKAEAKARRQRARQVAGDDFDEDDEEEEAGDEEAEDEEVPVLAYWRPMLHINAAADSQGFKSGAVPPPIGDILDADPVKQQYFPITAVNDFWLLSDALVEVNETTKAVPLATSFEGVSFIYLTLVLQMEQSFAMQRRSGVSKEGDGDMLKAIFLDTNPWLLGITAVISMLHMVFDVLAFQSDIAFWRRTKTMEGLSVRSIVMNLFFQVVILLYLWDNETTWMILISSFMGLGIEVWKLRKCMTLKIDWGENNDRTIPSLSLEDKDAGYTKSKTREYDEVAMAHLSTALYPLIIGYAAYSLFYDRHKSWYSWVISSLTGFVYLFGFITMTPQLFINYKMKSVAHMPWKAMVYKFLNTIVDDVFAFVVKMPTMHRISCFRDDIIFLIFLYQRWVYPEDPNRRNEFGVSKADLERAAAAKQGKVRVPKRSKFDRRTRENEPIEDDAAAAGAEAD